MVSVPGQPDIQVFSICMFFISTAVAAFFFFFLNVLKPDSLLILKTGGLFVSSTLFLEAAIFFNVCVVSGAPVGRCYVVMCVCVCDLKPGILVLSESVCCKIRCY